MSFTVPSFNLTCNIYTNSSGVPPGVYRLASACNLAVGRRVALSGFIGDEDTSYGSMTLLLPPLTDVRDAQSNTGPYGDFVEVPAGSGRLYFVTYVDDVGKGFSNEHRFAWLAKAVEANGGSFTGFFWPRPIP